MVRKVAVMLFEDTKGRLLLMLRDNKPTIPYPNHWGLIGGHIEEGETPQEAVKREVKEELKYKIKHFLLFKHYHFKDIESSYVFYTKGSYKLTDFRLNEGQKLKFFSKKECEKLKIAFEDKKIIEDYFKNNQK